MLNVRLERERVDEAPVRAPRHSPSSPAAAIYTHDARAHAGGLLKQRSPESSYVSAPWEALRQRLQQEARRPELPQPPPAQRRWHGRWLSGNFQNLRQLLY